MKDMNAKFGRISGQDSAEGWDITNVSRKPHSLSLRAKAAAIFGGAMLMMGSSALEAKAQQPAQDAIILAANDSAETMAAATASMSRSDELRLLRQAEAKSTDHAKAAHNVGLVLHVGDDIPPEHLQTVIDYYENVYQNIMLKSDDPRVRAGTAKIFPSPNPGTRSSGFSVTIGDQIYEIDNEAYGRPDYLDEGLLDLQTVELAAPEIIGQIPNAKVLQVENERDRTASLIDYDDNAPG